MSRNATPCELTNMIMIRDRNNGKVVAIRRQLSWTGVSFPGGHIEPGESITDSVIREAREETGLELLRVRPCGMVDWCHRETGKRYLVWLFICEDWRGELIPGTDEGVNFWAAPEELRQMPMSPHFETYLNVFLQENVSEAFGLHDDFTDDPMTLYRF